MSRSLRNDGFSFFLRGLLQMLKLHSLVNPPSFFIFVVAIKTVFCPLFLTDWAFQLSNHLLGPAGLVPASHRAHRQKLVVNKSQSLRRHGYPTRRLSSSAYFQSALCVSN